MSKETDALIKAEIFANCDLIGDCWVYRGTPNPAECYGQKWIEGRNRTPSRFILCCATGEPLDMDADACHDTVQCPYRACCNPKHLFWGSHADNCILREQDKRRFKYLLDVEEWELKVWLDNQTVDPTRMFYIRAESRNCRPNSYEKHTTII
jgi:hypothetical protein